MLGRIGTKDITYYSTNIPGFNPRCEYIPMSEEIYFWITPSVSRRFPISRNVCNRRLFSTRQTLIDFYFAFLNYCPCELKFQDDMSETYIIYNGLEVRFEIKNISAITNIMLEYEICKNAILELCSKGMQF